MGEKNTMKTYKEAACKIFYSFVQVIVRFFLKFVYGGPGQKMPPVKNLLLLESASSLALKIRTKKLSSLELVNSFIDRIEEVNPILNCLVDQRFIEARQEAEEADTLIRSGSMTEEQLAKEKPFLGVPFTTKDCIAVKGMIWTSGLWKRRTIVAEEDADSVAKLKEAGAIPIGLTNVSELCMWWESNNTIHGRTSNPYNTNHIVGGSSGGEGCIQAAAGSAFGIGSDIGGSIRIPSFFNGIFGHKPSKLIVSNKGQYPIPLKNTEQNIFLGIGPMCRHAEDLLPLLKILAGKNSEILRLDEKVDVKKIRYFYNDTNQENPFISPVDSEIKVKLHKVVNYLQETHGVKPERYENKRFNLSMQMWLALMKSPPDGPTFQEQLANLEGSINVPLEFIKWIFKLSPHTLIGLITSVVEKVGIQHGSEECQKLIQCRDKLKLELEDILGQDGVLLYTTHPTPAPMHIEPLVKAFNFSYTAIINILGFPTTHCPLGLSKDGLPIGIQVIANTNNDRLCLAVAKELQKAFGGWVPPAIEA